MEFHRSTTIVTSINDGLLTLLIQEGKTHITVARWFWRLFFLMYMANALVFWVKSYSLYSISCLSEDIGGLVADMIADEDVNNVCVLCSVFFFFSCR